VSRVQGAVVVRKVRQFWPELPFPAGVEEQKQLVGEAYCRRREVGPRSRSVDSSGFLD
jgi:hypothetical protein